LNHAAHRIQACVREVDTVARFGGDEFVVLLGELDSVRVKAEKMAAEVAEKIRTSLAMPYVLLAPDADGAAAVTHQASASVGVALFCQGLPTANQLLTSADAAMYAAKAGGRNRVEFAAKEP
jgi:diguanylate cyclase (GGDEF)-like protein